MKNYVLKAVAFVATAALLQGCKGIPVTKGEIDPAYIPVVQKMMGTYKGLYKFTQERSKGSTTVPGAEQGSVELTLALQGRKVVVTGSEDPTWVAMGRNCKSIIGDLSAVTVNKAATRVMAIFKYYPAACVGEIEGRTFMVFMDLNADGTVSKVKTELFLVSYALPIPGPDSTVTEYSRGTFYPKK